MALTNALELELPRALPAPGFWGQPRAARADACELPVTIRSDEPFEPLIAWAAAPERLVEEDPAGSTYWLHLPAAGRNNTQVVWDPQRGKLSVAVWARNVTQRERRAGSPGRLLWHAALWRPDADGAHATAHLRGGWLRVRLPRRGSG